MTKPVDYLQLEGMYFAEIELAQVQETCPVAESNAPVKVTVLPDAMGPIALVVAVIMFPEYATPLTKAEDWVAISSEAGIEPPTWAASATAFLPDEAARMTSETLARTV